MLLKRDRQCGLVFFLANAIAAALLLWQTARVLLHPPRRPRCRFHGRGRGHLGDRIYQSTDGTRSGATSRSIAYPMPVSPASIPGCVKPGAHPVRSRPLLTSWFRTH